MGLPSKPRVVAALISEVHHRHPFSRFPAFLVPTHGFLAAVCIVLDDSPLIDPVGIDIYSPHVVEDEIKHAITHSRLVECLRVVSLFDEI